MQTVKYDKQNLHLAQTSKLAELTEMYIVIIKQFCSYQILSFRFKMYTKYQKVFWSDTLLLLQSFHFYKTLEVFPFVNFKTINS